MVHTSVSDVDVLDIYYNLSRATVCVPTASTPNYKQPVRIATLTNQHTSRSRGERAVAAAWEPASESPEVNGLRTPEPAV